MVRARVSTIVLLARAGRAGSKKGMLFLANFDRTKSSSDDDQGSLDTAVSDTDVRVGWVVVVLVHQRDHISSPIYHVAA